MQTLDNNKLAAAEASEEVTYTQGAMNLVEDEQSTEEQVDQEPSEKDEEKSGFDFEKELSTRYGISSEDLKSGIEFVKNIQVQQLQVQAYNTLGEQWGVSQQEVGRRLAIVAEEFNKLPEAERASLDNVAGAIELWKKIEQNKSVNQTMIRGNSSATTSNKSFMFTQAQIDAMPENERVRRNKEIIQAYATGRVRGAL